MKMPNNLAQRAVGRPRTSKLTRTEQLRVAKRGQRERESKAGQSEARIKLPSDLAQRLRFVARQTGFVEALTKFLNSEAIEIDRYPQLKLLCWNRRTRYLTPEDAWSLYDRNWRFVESDQLEATERELIDSLFSLYGGKIKRD
jgi:hypothetical protein